MAKHKNRQPESGGAAQIRNSVGWIFWLVTFFLLYGPAWYLGYQSIYESERNGLVPWVIALTLAAIGAGLLSVAANFGLRRRAEALRKQARGQRKK